MCEIKNKRLIGKMKKQKLESGVKKALLAV